MKKFFVTGGAGFIGSAVVRLLIKGTGHQVLNLDKLTYAGNLESLSSVSKDPRYSFVHGDVCNRDLVSKLLTEFQPDVVMHLAAESHVDRSIDKPCEFIQTNIVGTSVMLECAREYWSQLTSSESQAISKGALDDINSHLSKPTTHSVTRESFRFHHVSTDEVYGSLDEKNFFTETTAYDPTSPYSASKASSDHLVRAWHRTYGLPILITNCSNNFGPYQYPEKLIPLIILNALEQKPIPIYGNGNQVRDWLHVDDHSRALYKVAMEGKVGETYNIGCNNEKTNLEVAFTICDIFDDLFTQRLSSRNLSSPNGDTNLLSADQHNLSYNLNTPTTAPAQSCRDLITHVADRPGHDQRYAINAKKIRDNLGWRPQETFETGLRKTIEWYMDNLEWCQRVQGNTYGRERLGKPDNQKGQTS